MIRDLIQQLRSGIWNLVMEILGIFRKPYQLVSGLFSPKEEEIEIPEEWMNPEVITEGLSVPVTPVAIEPSIVFEEPMKPGFKIKSPPWFLKSKRVLAFILFIGCCISAIGLIFTFPTGLIFVIPTGIINLDYLLKTQSKTNRMRWYILDDVEELEE